MVKIQLDLDKKENSKIMLAMVYHDFNKKTDMIKHMIRCFKLDEKKIEECSEPMSDKEIDKYLKSKSYLKS